MAAADKKLPRNTFHKRQRGLLQSRSPKSKANACLLWHTGTHRASLILTLACHSLSFPHVPTAQPKPLSQPHGFQRASEGTPAAPPRPRRKAGAGSCPGLFPTRSRQNIKYLQGKARPSLRLFFKTLFLRSSFAHAINTYIFRGKYAQTHTKSPLGTEGGGGGTQFRQEENYVPFIDSKQKS